MKADQNVYVEDTIDVYLEVPNEISSTIPIHYPTGTLCHAYHLLYDNTVTINGSLLIENLEDDPYPMVCSCTYVVVLGNLILENDDIINIENGCGLIVLGDAKAENFKSSYGNIIY